MIEVDQELKSIPRTKRGYEYTYATLDGVLDVLRAVLPAHGLWFTQWPVNAPDGGIDLHTRVMHISGEYFEVEYTCQKTEISKGKPNDTQLIGASITYFRRYILCAIFGVTTDEDTDGVAPVQPSTPIQTQKKQEKSGSQVEKKKDPLAFLLAHIAYRIKRGETKASVLDDLCGMMQISPTVDVTEMDQNTLRSLATEVYKRDFGGGQKK
jgi:hypothetical protein